MTHSRLDRLLAGLHARHCDAVVLSGPLPSVHLAGYQRSGSGPVALVVDDDGGRTLVVPAYEVETATREADVERVVGFGDGSQGLDLEADATLATAVADLLTGGHIGVADDVGLEAVRRTGAEAVPIAGLVAGVRRVKDPDEVRRIAQSHRLCWAAQDAVSRAARPGAREIELLSLAHATVQNAAGRPIEFGGDLLAGARTALVGGPIAVAGDATVAADDLILADLAAQVDGYWGVSARTSIVGAMPEAARAMDAIGALQAEVAAQLRPGALPSAQFRTLAEGIGERLPGALFPHHAGHGVGVTGFEPPHLIPGDDEPLVAGTIVSVEPGAYYPGRFGVRCENLYLITDDGGIELTELAEGDL